MPADSLTPPPSGVSSGFLIEHVEALGNLATVSLNAVFEIHHAAWLIPAWKPLIAVSAMGELTKCVDRLRGAVESLSVLSPQLPDYPFDDPFAGGTPITLGLVTATSAHAACFLMARRCIDLVRLSYLGFDLPQAPPGAGALTGLLAKDHSDTLRLLQTGRAVPDPIPVAWTNECDVERLTRFMRGLFVTNAPAGLAQGEAIRAAYCLCEEAETINASERIAARKHARIIPAEPIIWAHGGRAYSHDGISPVLVSETEDYILTAFCEQNCAMDTRELENKSGVTNVSRAVAYLCKKYDRRFAGAISTPTKAAKGTGYYIRVREAKSAD